MKLWEKVKNCRESKNGKRFYTALDMAIVKHEEMILNSLVKRGKLMRKANRYISVCGCGVEGCFIHGSYNNK